MARATKVKKLPAAAGEEVGEEKEGVQGLLLICSSWLHFPALLSSPLPDVPHFLSPIPIPLPHDVPPGFISVWKSSRLQGHLKGGEQSTSAQFIKVGTSLKWLSSTWNMVSKPEKHTLFYFNQFKFKS